MLGSSGMEVFAQDADGEEFTEAEWKEMKGDLVVLISRVSEYRSILLHI
jgi:hypothetical protein